MIPTFGGLPPISGDSQAAELSMLRETLEQAVRETKTTGICADRCIASPGTSLSKSQQSCIWNCAQRYVEASFFVDARSAAMVNQQQNLQIAETQQQDMALL
eukprot:Selendium_serpulae@DN4855_c0_g1_i1.p5